MRFLGRALIGLFLTALTVGLLAMAGYTTYGALQARWADEGRPPPTRERVFAAEVAPLVFGEETPILTAFGEIRSRRTLELRAPAEGTVIELADGFEDGGAVVAGQLLMRIDPAEARSARDTAQADLRDAENELTEATRALDLAEEEVAAARIQAELRTRSLQRAQDLAARGVGSTAAVEEAELAEANANQQILVQRRALAQAEARVDSAGTALDRRQIALAEAERRLAQTALRAEFNGVLTEVDIAAGRLVSRNERVGALIDADALEVAFRISTAQYIRLLDADGNLPRLPVRVVLDVFGLDVQADAVLTRESGAVEEGQSGRLLFAQINSARGLRVGDFVGVEVDEPPLPRAARLPAAAYGSDGQILVLGEENVLEAVRVDLLRRQGDDVLVAAVDGADLQGREVVLARTPVLGEGIRVNPVRPETGDAAEADPDTIALDPDRRARLIAFVEGNTFIPDDVRTRMLQQLAEEEVPSRMVARLEARMEADAMAMRAIPASAGGIISYFTRHRTAANLVLVMMVVAGLAAFPQMRAQFFPDVVSDDINVVMTWEGAGAEDVDTAIVAVVEPALLLVPGVSGSEASSREGRASIELTFEPGWDMSRAADEVQQALDAVTDLPEDAEEGSIRRGNWFDRVTDIVITGPVATEQIGRFADELVGRLFDVGVTNTTIRGIAAPETLVVVPSANLIRYDVSMAEISSVIAAAADTAPAGDVDAANARVRTGSEARSAEAIANLTLRINADGSVLSVGDVARIEVNGIDRERAYFVGDNPAITVRVDRTEEGDALAIQAQVEDVAEALQATLPAGTTIDLINTRAEAISGRLNILMDNAVLGLGLVVALLFLFLNARTAFWVAMGIPAALIAAIALMYVAGITINMISLFALIITLGIVVDDAIVVGEHADYRARHLGEPPVIAAENAARRMAAPVFSATITTVLAFAALVAIGGRFGDLIADIPFTVIVVLLASLVECFLVLPNHMAHALAHSARTHWYDMPSRIVNRGFDWVNRTAFRPLMRFVIWARYPVIAAVIALLSTQTAQFIRGDVVFRFFNAPETGSVTGNFAMVDGATRADTMEQMRELQRAAEVVGAAFEAEHGLNPLAYVLAEVGGNSGRPLGGTENKDEGLLGALSIELIDADLRPAYSSFAFAAALQDEVRQLPLTETISFRGWRGGPGGDSIDVQIFGADTATLKAASEALQSALAQYPEVTGLDDSMSYDREELSLELTPQGEALGFEIAELGRTLRNRLGGIEAASFPDGPRTATIRVELPEGELTADFLDRTLLRSASGQYVPLADIVTVTARQGFSTIQRENGVRLISVSGDLSEDDPARAEAVMTELREIIAPRIEEDFGVATQLSGLAEDQQEFLTDALTGFLLCLVGIYLVLAWIFASWLRPIVVMAIIPFGLAGTIFGHVAWDVPLSLFTVVGLIGMTGIIINDSIVLVTTVDEYAEKRGLFPAIIDGACDRLRPVMLTTLTTVLGLMPLLYETSQDAQFLKPTVITLVYGLGFGFFVVLLVVPALLAIGQDFGQQMRGFRRALGSIGPRPSVGMGLGALTLATVALFVATLGAQIVQGAMWGPFAALQGGAPQAFAAFILGTAVICVAGWVIGLLVRLLPVGRKPDAAG